jgi:hypothetical protein
MLAIAWLSSDFLLRSLPQCLALIGTQPVPAVRIIQWSGALNAASIFVRYKPLAQN